MIMLSTDLVASLGSPTVASDAEAAAGANDFLLQLLAQLHQVETSAVAPAELPVLPTLPNVSLGEVIELNMGTVTPEQVDDERHVLEQLLHRLHDLVSEVLGPFPQVPDTPAVPQGDGEGGAPRHNSSDAALQLAPIENSAGELPLLRQDSGEDPSELPLLQPDNDEDPVPLQLPNARAERIAPLAASEHGAVFELPVTAPTPPSLQRRETMSVPRSAPTGVVVELDEGVPAQPVPSSVMAQHSTEQVEVVPPVVGQTAEVESPDSETRPHEPGLPGENDQQLPSRTGGTTITQPPVHEGNTLGSAPATPSFTGAVASVVSAVVEEPAAAEPLAMPDGADDAMIAPIRALTPLRSLSVPRNTVVLQVEPPELGILVVQVRQVDEHFTASFWAESSEVRSLLQGHFPALNQALNQQGFQVAQLALNMHLGQSFAGHAGSFAQQHALATPFSHGQPEGEHEPLDTAGIRFAGAPSRGYSSGHVDIMI